MTDQNFERRIDELIEKMTVEEKAGQVNQSGFGPYREYIASDTGLGHLVEQGGRIAKEQAERLNEIQQLGLSHSRPKIPIMIGCDGIYDARVDESVTFPQQINMGSTWDDDLIERVYSAIGRELKAVGYARSYAPNIGIARDPRFGRTGECYSEDPRLVTRMGVAAVKGFMSAGIMATPKHYAAHDASEGGKDSSAMDVSERALREVWLPSFKAAVEAGAGAIMCAYHAVNGVPMAANRYLLTDILKNEWGFDGFVVTDYMCVKSLWDLQHVAATYDEALKLGFESGVDVYDHDMGEGFSARMAELVKSGYISEKTLDEAVRRVLRAKFKAGLFDDPFVDPEKASEVVGCREHIDLALETSLKSIVLLKNEGSLLPLKKDISSVAVIGPCADNVYAQLGVWTKDRRERDPVTILQGIESEVSSKTEVRYAKGCGIIGARQPVPDGSLMTPDGRNGLKGEYFDNPELSGTPFVTRIDKNVDFDWLKDSEPPVNPETLSARWTGKLRVPASGRYRFRTRIDYGARVFLDGKKIIDKWETYIGADNISLNLATGREYDLRVEYHATKNNSRVRFTIESQADESAGIQEAVKIAKKSDAAIVLVGDDPDLNAETHDRADLELTGAQNELVKAVYETGTPTVVVMVNARPLLINWIAENVQAIVEAWNPGQMGGEAVAKVLFGDYNPGGRLPITFPRSTGQLPVFYNHEPGWHGNYACGTPTSPLFPFGFGLSYTTFEYGEIRLSSPTMPTDGKVEVSVDVKNTGDRAGDEVVQLYIHDQVASTVRPVKELRNFKRITLEPGETKTVTLALTADDLAFYNPRGEKVVEPGLIDVMVGGSSDDLKTAVLEVVKK